MNTPEHGAEQHAPGELHDIPVVRIKVGPRLRQPNDLAVKALAESIKGVGLLSPITVRAPAEEGGLWDLSAGAGRLAAAILLKWETIPAFVLPPASDQKAREIEIVENIVRNELNALELGLFLSKLKEINVAGGNARGPGRPSENIPPNSGELPRAFADAVSARLKMSRSSINAAINRVKIAKELLSLLAETEAAHNGVALDAIAALTADQQRELAGHIKPGMSAGEVRHHAAQVRGALRKGTRKEKAAKERRAALVHAWRRAHDDDRRYALLKLASAEFLDGIVDTLRQRQAGG